MGARGDSRCWMGVMGARGRVGPQTLVLNVFVSLEQHIK